MTAKIKLLVTIPLLVLSLSACKEEEPFVDPCKNNFLDPGEEKVDCGGTCPDCAIQYNPTLFCKVNGISTSFYTKTLQKTNDQWYLSCENDTCLFYINMGSNGAVGTYNLESSSYIFFQGIQYNNEFDATYTISSHDIGARRMSGFFQGKFARPNNVDTVYITGGQFQDLKY